MPLFRRNARRLHREDGGAALLEMAVVFPVLFTLGLGVIEFGNLFFTYHLIANGVRDAGRYASGLVGDVCGNATLQTSIKNIAMTGQNNVAAAVGSTGNRVSWWTNSATVTVACGPPIADTGNVYRVDNIRSVTVSAAVPYNSLGFLGYLGLNAITLGYSHQERLIGGR